MTEKLRASVRSNFFGSGHESLKSYVYARIKNKKNCWNIPVQYIYLLTNVVSVSISGPLYSILNLEGENVQRSVSQKSRFDFTFLYLNIYYSHKSTGFQLYLVHIIIYEFFLPSLYILNKQRIRPDPGLFCKIQFRVSQLRIKLEICLRNQKMDWNPQP
jgi:hypothetical protein